MIECLSTDILLRDANERTKAQEDEENPIAIAHPKNGSSVSSISSLITTKTMEERIKLKMLLSVKTL
jgi:hypothetical protein